MCGPNGVDTLPIVCQSLRRILGEAHAMDKRYIERQSRALLRQVVEARAELFPTTLPHPVQQIDPENIARHLKFEFAYIESLASWGRARTGEVAGLLDKQRRLISISTRFPYEVQRFTAGHELGHIWLEHPGTVIHRDLPIFELKPDSVRDPMEQEADYFAACLLAPRELVTVAYKIRFGLGPPLPLSDAVAWNLCGEDAHKLLSNGVDGLRFGVAVARAERFNGNHFTSLAAHFGISVSAMAIRLRELGLIDR